MTAPGRGETFDEQVEALGALMLARGRGPLEQDFSAWEPRAWHGLALLAIRQRAAPLVSDRLERLWPSSLPLEIAKRLKDQQVHARMKSIAIREDLGEALDALRARGVEVIPLKGAVLADLVYEDPAHRPMGDLDLLIRPESAAAAVRALASLGYEPIQDNPDFDYSNHHHLRPMGRLGSLPIELHTGLGPPGEPFDIDYDGLWERAVPRKVAGRQVPTMSTEDLILHLSTHLTHEFDVPVIGVYDIAELIRSTSPDWVAMSAEAHSDGRAPFVRVALGLVDRLFGIRPEGAHEAFPSDLEIDRIVEGAYHYLLSAGGDAPDWIRAVGERQTIAGRFRALVRILMPAPVTMRRLYGLEKGSPLVYPLYLWRPIDLLWRRGCESLGWATDGAVRARELRRRELHAWSRSVAGN